MNKNNTWSKEDLDFLRENYNKYSSKEIGEMLNRTRCAVQLKINKIGLKREDKYFYNENFFENIDSEEKAYWLGFIYADGYIQIDKEKRIKKLGMELQIGDIEHLKKFNKSIEGNVDVKIRERYDYRYDKSYSQCVITLYKGKIVDDLINHGISTNKSRIITFPKIDKEMIIPFIRGFFDGDGCLILNKDRTCHRFDFTCASIDFVNSLRSILYEEYNISSYITKETNKEVYRLNIRGLTNGYLFGKLLYQDANIYLDRKYKKFYSITEDYDILNRIRIKKIV